MVFRLVDFILLEQVSLCMAHVQLSYRTHKPNWSIVFGHQEEADVAQFIDFAHLFLSLFAIQTTSIEIVVVGTLPLQRLDGLQLLVAVG